MPLALFANMQKKHDGRWKGPDTFAQAIGYLIVPLNAARIHVGLLARLSSRYLLHCKKVAKTKVKTNFALPLATPKAGRHPSQTAGGFTAKLWYIFNMNGNLYKDISLPRKKFVILSASNSKVANGE